MTEATAEPNFEIDKFKEKIYMKYIYQINGTKVELINKTESYDQRHQPILLQKVLV